MTPSAARFALPTEPWRSAIVLTLFATLLLIVGPRHEPWFDEAQAWLIGRDTTLWDLLAHRVRYEGSPGLWHALLWLLSHAGMPFQYLWLVSGALACIGAWIILTRAPFPYWLRVGVIFSYFVAYQYAIVARSYALDLVLIPLIAVNFADRLRRPMLYGLLLGLIANVNAHSFIIAGVLFAEFLVALWRSQTWQAWTWQRAHLSGAAIYLAFAGAAVLQAWPPSDVSFLASADPHAGRGILVFIEAFIDRWDLWSASGPTDLSTALGVALTALLLAPSLILFGRAGIGMLAIGTFAALFAFSILKFANVWHAGIVYLFWIFALWIGWNALADFSAARRRVTVASIAVIVFANVSYTASASLREIREPYSAAPAAAQILASEQRRVAAFGFKTFAVQAWFAANAFRNYRGGAPDEAYYAWTTSESFLPFAAAGSWQETLQDSRYDMLLLSIHKLSTEEIAHYAATARSAGYCKPDVLPGGLIWKSYVFETDTMLVFRRCADGVARNSR